MGSLAAIDDGAIRDAINELPRAAPGGQNP
jgi:hypothetical protein